MDASFHIRPFAFDRVFEAPGRSLDDADAEELRLRVAALEVDLSLARHGGESELSRARAEGHAAGLAEARAEREAALLAATDALHAVIEDVEGSLERIADDAARDAAGVAHAAAELLAGHALAHAPGAAIDAAIGRVLRQVARGQEIQVSVAPDLVAEVERLIAVRQDADRRRLALIVVGDPALAFGDAHIHWEQGGVVLDAATRAAALRAALEPVLPRIELI